eukprot:4628587-Amphidinium_carterae.1
MQDSLPPAIEKGLIVFCTRLAINIKPQATLSCKDICCSTIIHGTPVKQPVARALRSTSLYLIPLAFTTTIAEEMWHTAINSLESPRRNGTAYSPNIN